jgi:hypothetical protein
MISNSITVATAIWGAVSGTLGVIISGFNAWKAHEATRRRFEMRVYADHQKTIIWFVGANSTQAPITVTSAFIALGSYPKYCQVFNMQENVDLPLTCQYGGEVAFNVSIAQFNFQIETQLTQLSRRRPIWVNFLLTDTLDNVYRCSFPLFGKFEAPVYSRGFGRRIVGRRVEVRDHKNATDWTTATIAYQQSERSICGVDKGLH